MTPRSAQVASGQRLLHVSLTALFRVLGHCVIAMAAVPVRARARASCCTAHASAAPAQISRRTIIYGCDDASRGEARTVHVGARCPAALPAIAKVAVPRTAAG